MEISFFNVGVPTEDVAFQLSKSPIVSIIGFQGSGKSRLSRELSQSLPAYGYSTHLQDATMWLPNRVLLRGSTDTGAEHAGSINPEILAVLDKFKKSPAKWCWIIDNAEVLIAHATEALLHGLGNRLRRQDFALILVRNRFVLENEGWLYRRLSIIAPSSPNLVMHPMRFQDSVELASKMFYGYSQLQQAEWLAAMSGGIPGLIHELYRYTPQWPSSDLTPELVQFIAQKRKELRLNQIGARDLITKALWRQLLPPFAFLSKTARMDLGFLILKGMISPNFFWGNPIQGEFWKLVAEQSGYSCCPGDRFEDIGLNLEIMVRLAGLEDAFNYSGISVHEQGAIAQAFAANLYCEQKFPDLVHSLKSIFTESLGKSGLSKILKAKNAFEATTDSSSLVNTIFRLAEA
jgi:hypothetical protein